MRRIHLAWEGTGDLETLRQLQARMVAERRADVPHYRRSLWLQHLPSILEMWEVRLG